MNFKLKDKIDGPKMLSIGVTVLGVVGTLLSGVVDKNNRKELKNELKEEILKELSDQ